MTRNNIAKWGAGNEKIMSARSVRLDMLGGRMSAWSSPLMSMVWSWMRKFTSVMEHASVVLLSQHAHNVCRDSTWLMICASPALPAASTATKAGANSARTATTSTKVVAWYACRIAWNVTMLTNATSAYRATTPVKMGVCFARIAAVSVVLPNPARSV